MGHLISAVFPHVWDNGTHKFYAVNAEVAAKFRNGRPLLAVMLKISRMDALKAAEAALRAYINTAMYNMKRACKSEIMSLGPLRRPPQLAIRKTELLCQ